MIKKNFTWEDLDSYAKTRVDKKSPILELKKHRWTKVGRYMIILLDQWWTCDWNSAQVIAQKNRSLLNLIFLPFARVFGKKEWVTSTASIPLTNVILNTWYDGKGNDGIVLAAEMKNP